MEEMVGGGYYVVKGGGGGGATAALCGGNSGSTASAAGAGGSKCGRWNPTAEQVKVLTELFRAGLRTPSTEQIQRISSHLSAFGKIESKNVFYWFQNHKARERLHHKKRRREPPPLHPIGHHHHHPLHYTDGSGGDFFTALPQEPGGRAGKREAPSSRLSIAFAEEGVVDERERETLELFPLRSYEPPVRVVRAERRDDLLFSTGRDHPPLDLRLSSL
ncbi:hypothetical protein Taro_025773 [Colocasia esculenta]|uniref:Homeobox domain-containing protein n=1 Tax=Colocasia esculenta TaxID=4460 RepID=A0A843V9R5_COLES|nr:hypothetical protein [Colocasia esculenta]